MLLFCHSIKTNTTTLHSAGFHKPQHPDNDQLPSAWTGTDCSTCQHHHDKDLDEPPSRHTTLTLYHASHKTALSCQSAVAVNDKLRPKWRETRSNKFGKICTVQVHSPDGSASTAISVRTFTTRPVMSTRSFGLEIPLFVGVMTPSNMKWSWPRLRLNHKLSSDLIHLAANQWHGYNTHSNR